jgi:hypothetical protein
MNPSKPFGDCSSQACVETLKRAPPVLTAHRTDFAIHVRCSVDLRDHVNEVCKRHDMTQQGFMTMAIWHYLRVLEKAHDIQF